MYNPNDKKHKTKVYAEVLNWLLGPGMASSTAFCQQVPQCNYLLSQFNEFCTHKSLACWPVHVKCDLWYSYHWFKGTIHLP